MTVDLKQELTGTKERDGKTREPLLSPTASPGLLPDNFTLAYYRLTLEALETLHLPAFKGSALRGGFGHTFKRLVCAQPRQCQKYCQVGNVCPYGYIFETAPPDDSEVLRTFNEVPRPFVITVPSGQKPAMIAMIRPTMKAQLPTF